MSSQQRRSGAKLQKVIQSAADPAAIAGVALLYGKAVAGSAVPFMRSGSPGALVSQIAGLEAPLTDGSLLFANSLGQIAQNNAQIYWQNSGNRLGVGTNTPGVFAGDADIQPDTIAHFTRTGVALNTFVLVEAGTALDAGIALFTDTANEDFALWLDHSDARKLMWSMGAIEDNTQRTASIKMTLTQAGLLGIGTTAPAQPLDIRMTTAADGGMMTLQNNAANGFSDILFNSSAPALELAVGYGNAGVSIAHIAGLNFAFSANSKNIVFANPTAAEHTFGMTNGSAFHQMDNGSSAAVSAAGTARIRYNEGAGTLQVSFNGGAYVTFQTA